MVDIHTFVETDIEVNMHDVAFVQVDKNIIQVAIPEPYYISQHTHHRHGSGVGLRQSEPVTRGPATRKKLPMDGVRQRK